MDHSDASPSRRNAPVRWLGTLGIALLVGAAIVVMAKYLGFRSPVFAFNLHFILMAGAVWVDKLLAPRLDGDRFEVSPREVRFYRRLGAIGFMMVLRRIGWEAVNRDRSVFDGTRRTLPAYETATRHGENAHTWIFLISLAPIAWALAKGWWDAALWIGSMSVVFHVYPIMLQRTQRARLAAVLTRVGEGRAGAKTE